MVLEGATHQSKPFDQMPVTEQIAENIFQLRNVDAGFWIMNSRYPIEGEGTPVHRLVDFGYEAVPQLIEALDDHRFTRSMEPRFNGLALPRSLRVSDIAHRVLQHISGRIFFEEKTNDGRLVKGTIRQQAEAWWAEIQSKGEKQALFDQVAAGGQSSEQAVRKLIERYPDSAIDAIRAGISVATNSLERGALVALASDLKGEDTLAFLRSKLATGVEVPSQVAAAKALLKRGQPEAVPAMISVWRDIQPRLAKNENDAYDEVGQVITFLAKSQDAAAVDALSSDIRRAPVEVRLAAVQVFLPWPRSAGASSTGKGVHVEADIEKLPGGAAGAAIERFLLASLEDTEQRREMKGTYNEVSYEDPRICDMAALVLSKRWPEKYVFNWPSGAAERDAQIAAITRK